MRKLKYTSDIELLNYVCSYLSNEKVQLEANINTYHDKRRLFLPMLERVEHQLAELEEVLYELESDWLLVDYENEHSGFGNFDGVGRTCM